MGTRKRKPMYTLKGDPPDFTAKRHDVPDYLFSEGDFSFHQPVVDFASLERLAERLGIAPVEPAAEVKPWLLLCLPDGRKFDAFGIASALLDRLEELSR